MENNQIQFLDTVPQDLNDGLSGLSSGLASGNGSVWQKLSERTSKTGDVSARNNDLSVKTEGPGMIKDHRSETDEASEKGKIQSLLNQI